METDNQNIKEVAKAAAEVSKFGTQTVQTTEKILGFIAKVFKSPAEDTAGIIGDRLKLFRWERQLAYVDKVNNILFAKGITDTRAVPPKFSLPVIENASLEDDDELQKLWANMLANAMNPTFTVNMRTAFIDIIKSLTILDVKILKTFYEALKQNSSVDWNNILNYSLKKEQICQLLSIGQEDYEVSVFNLFRVQCLAPAIITGGISMGAEPLTVYKGSKAVTLTPLGVDFIKSAIEE